MTIAKTDQVEKDYRYVTKKRPWLIPVSWAVPGQLAEYTADAAKSFNARLKDAFRQRKKRASRRAKAIVDPTHRFAICSRLSNREFKPSLSPSSANIMESKGNLSGYRMGQVNSRGERRPSERDSAPVPGV